MRSAYIVLRQIVVVCSVPNIADCDPCAEAAAEKLGYVRQRTESAAYSVYASTIRSRSRARTRRCERITTMLYTVAVVLLGLWLLGLVTAYTLGGLIHVLLGMAIAVAVLRLISDRSVP
jgi:hypothetical protein